jgi:3-hydroxyacyl-CoA dehydrogenase/enoyl-CoA hydratase/3-hydroxybutyryl-CoA epimerase
MTTHWQHWQLERDHEQLAWLTFNKAGESTNTLSKAVMEELSSVLDTLDQSPPKGLIIRSGKSAGFIAGADIGEFSALSNTDEAGALIRRGWELYNRLAKVPYTSVALVRGHCMGGGTELALACRVIVVVDQPSTKMALPEVLLGIIPGWGGMARLPHRVGAPAALDMMLTGKGINAKKAYAMGLADACVPPRVMDAAARMLALTPPSRKKLPFLTHCLTYPLKKLTAYQAKMQVAKRARFEHYPAPYAIIDCWAKHQGDPTARPGLVEMIAGGKSGNTARHLVRVFHLQDQLKQAGKPIEGMGTFEAKRVHVVGAGVMGGDIAAWCALSGMTVTLQDQDINRIAPAITRALTHFHRKYSRDALARRDVADRLIPDPTGSGIGQADVIIEAIVEDLPAKQALFADISRRAKPNAILASNTSSLKVEAIRSGMSEPERLVGIHFFNPVRKMPLVEIVAGEGTSAIAVNHAAQFVRAIDRLPLLVKSAPGFLVNAVLAPYMLEAMRMVDEGMAIADVDAAAVGFGMPMGPMELIDTVGLDVALAAGAQLTSAPTAPACLQARVDRGELGCKSGQGFYTWRDGKIVSTAKTSLGAQNKMAQALTSTHALMIDVINALLLQRDPPAQPPISAHSQALAKRLLHPLIARTQALVDLGIVASADLADAGVIFGTGFAPFRGGPLCYAKSENLNLA